MVVRTFGHIGISRSAAYILMQAGQNIVTELVFTVRMAIISRTRIHGFAVSVAVFVFISILAADTAVFALFGTTGPGIRAALLCAFVSVDTFYGVADIIILAAVPVFAELFAFLDSRNAFADFRHACVAIVIDDAAIAFAAAGIRTFLFECFCTVCGGVAIGSGAFGICIFGTSFLFIGTDVILRSTFGHLTSSGWRTLGGG